uniref:Putative 1-phosphatidylinositol-3-phosphate 5-kinase FAB1D isoform X1 n=1 Tax=Rhizophora mucronata TaxID=61149 RepID=A0A2P2ME70_RHIMU
MCHCCGLQVERSNDEKKPENKNTVESNGEGSIWFCRFCQEQREQESAKLDGLTPSVSLMSGSTTSLSSSDRSLSSCSDVSVDVNSSDRSNQEGVVADNAQDIGYGFNGHLHQSRSDGTLNVADRLCKRSENNFNEKPNGSDRGTVRNVEILRTANQETKDSCSENAVGPNSQNENFYSVDEEIEAQLWEPPEGEDSEDEFKATVAFSDDDDEYGDGTKWGKPSSLSSSGDEGRGSRHFKEEKQKAMDEVFHGKFKTVVSQLLKTESVASSGNDGANWVDIVTSLSWEAALFLKPDAVNGKAIDPNNCVKVKCIATGSRNER